MSGALWFYFWDNNPTWGVSASAAEATSSVTNAGGGHRPSNDYIDYEAMAEAREAYLNSIYLKVKRPVKVPKDEEWPDPPLKPRRRRV